MKKLFSLLLAMLLIVSMVSVSVLADDGYTISVADGDDHAYDVFQIFTGDLSGDILSGYILSNVKWGASAKLPSGAKVGDPVPDSVLAELAALGEETSDTKVLEVIAKYIDVNSAAPVKTVDSKTSYTAAPGYYLIKDTANFTPAAPYDPEDPDAYTLYIVNVVNDVEIARKAGVPEVDKKILEANGQTFEKVNVNEANIGDKVPYEITATMPKEIADYGTYFLQFNDTLTKGLTYNNDLTVTVNGFDVTKYFFVNAGTYSETAGTTIKVTIADLKALANLEEADLYTEEEIAAAEKDETELPLITIDDKTEVVVTYSATLNENAVIGGPNPNTVDLKFNNNPNKSGNGTPDKPQVPSAEPTTSNPTGTTPDSKVDTYTTELTLYKVDENGQVLLGAEFTLTGDFNKVIVKTAETFTKDANGDYWKLAGTEEKYTTEAPIDEAVVEAADGDLVKLGENEKVPEGVEALVFGEATYIPATDAQKEDDEITKYKHVLGNHEEYASISDKYTKTVTTEVLGGTGTDAKDVKATVGKDGTITFTGLGAGKYTLKETKTPDGFNTIDPIDFEVTFDVVDDVPTFGATAPVKVVTGKNTLEITVENKSGSVLPETGGIGTTIFYVLGSVLLVGAAVLLITRRRMGANN